MDILPEAEPEKVQTASPFNFTSHPIEDSTGDFDTDTDRIDIDTSRSRDVNEVRVSRGNLALAAVRQQGKGLFQESYLNKKFNGRRTVRENQESIIRGGGSSYRLMEFSRGLGALLAMYEATNEKQYLDEAFDLAERVIAVAQKGKEIKNNPKNFKDDFYGWANKNPNFEKRKSGGQHLQEIPLFESYLFRYLAKMSYLVKTDAGLKADSEFIKRADKLSDFVKTNGWDKWYQRGEKQRPGCFPYLFRQRTHMTSHWAIVALYLRELSNSEAEKANYSKFLSLFDQQLKDNFRVGKNDAYVWNMTWDSAWPFGTACNKAPKSSIIQDVSHGNNVVTYVVEAHDLSKSVWSDVDIQRLANTVKYVLYNAEKNGFNKDLKGVFAANSSSCVGLSDGFVKLARYDAQLVDLFEKVSNGNLSNAKFSLDEPQFIAELTLAKKMFVTEQ